MTGIRSAITAVHGYVPDYVLTNEELATMVDTNDEWIQSRTGVKERRILKGDGQGSSVLGAEAYQGLCKKLGIDPDEIDMLICATATPDMLFPATANLITDKVGAVNAFGYDIMAACSGFLFALTTGSKFVESGSHKKVVVVGADKMSSIVDYTDRTTCILFGDGAGAVLLEPSEDENGIIDSVLRSDGSGSEFLYLRAGGSAYPASHETVDNKQHYIYQEGQTVFKFAVKKMAEVSVEVMERNDLNGSDIDWLVPHQANRRIIDATANMMDLDHAKVMLNIHKYGNTTSGTIPLCLWDWEDKLNKGDNLILAAFGGGFTWGAIYVKWAYNA